ncbi:MAG: DUF2786 domain-containing protein [Frankiaceae bacterium]|nr:DUF2786 domain-containing protein [Frankiaceae bacterium]MBV9871892.1 DUF2786 domain-containing protein [Frankiaceae bacterium]
MADPILERVRKLLAVAEHPNTPVAEADAAAQAAERLIAKYAIDEALLEAGAARHAVPEVRTLVVEAPYASAKTVLVGAVARAYGVRAITLGGGELTRMSLVGFATDLTAVEMLYTSLLLQATTSLRRQAETGRAFRRAFLIGFAAEVSDRLRTAHEEAVAETDVASTALVLRKREDEVDRALREHFPRLRQARVTVSSGHGLTAGRRSGAEAVLSARDQVSGGRSALPR